MSGTLKTNAKKSFSFLMAMVLIFSMLSGALPEVKAIATPTVVIALSTNQGDVSLIFDKTIQTLPADVGSDFEVMVNGNSVSVSSASLTSGTPSKIKLTLATKITGADTATVSYTYNNSNPKPIIASDTSVLDSFVAQPVEINTTAPVISNNLQDVSTPEGTPVSLNSTATVPDFGTITYQWYRADDVSKTNASAILGATSATYSPTVKTMGISYYYCAVTNTTTVVGTKTNTIYSDVSTYTVTAPTNAAVPIITQDLTDKTTNIGTPVSLDATATVVDNGAITYAWYKNTTRSDVSSTLLASETSPALSPDVSTAGTAYYYCVITSTNNDATNTKFATATTSIAAVTVNALVNAETPIITNELTAVTATETLPVTLDATAIVGDGGTLSYQWYRADDVSKTNASLIAGETAATYSPAVNMIGTYYYYCIITNTNTDASITGASTATSSSAVASVTVVIKPVINSIEVTSQGDVSLIITPDTKNYTTAKTVYSNLQSDFIVTVDGTPVVVTSVAKTSTQNKIKLTLATKATSGQTVTVGYTYNASRPILAADGSTILSFAFNTTSPVIATNLTNKATTVGTPITLDATATVVDAGTISYQWYKADDASKTNASQISGATGATYSPAVNSIGTYYYYCIVTNTNNAVSGVTTASTTTVVSTVTVSAEPVVYISSPTCSVSTNGGTSYTDLASAKIYGNATPIPKFKLTFDRNVTANIATNQSYFTMSNGTSSVAVQISAGDANSIIVTPSSALNVGTYTLTVGQAIASSDGKNLQADVTLTITVTANPLNITSVTFNGVALDGATITEPTPELKIACDRGMVENLSSNISMIRLYKGSTLISSSVYMKTTAEINDEVEKRNIYVMPTAALTNGTYTLQILGGLKSNNGNTLSDDPTVVFKSYAFTVSLVTTPTTETTVNATSTISGSTAKASVSTASMQDLITGAKSTETGGGKAEVVIKVETQSDTSAVNLTIPGTSFAELAGGTAAELKIDTGIGSVTFPAAAVDSISKAAGAGDISIKIGAADKSTLSAEAQKLIGDRPVYDFTINAGSTTISSFGGSVVTVNMPYTLAAGEDSNNIVIYYLSASGEVIPVRSCVYNTATGTVTFMTTHFSSYAIGYNKVTFTDVSGWYVDSVNYLSARGIVSGLGDGTYNPGGTISRAQVVTMLANLSGDDLSVYLTSSFGDITTTDWYFKAVEWAKDNGIVKGYEGNFNPNGNITRQDFAVMLSRYASAFGYTLASSNKAVSFTDNALIAAYAAGSVKQMQLAGVISGYGDGSYGPEKNATRAEASKMVAMFVKGMIAQ